MSQYNYTKKPNWSADARHPSKITEAGCVLSNSATTCTRVGGSFIDDGVTAGMSVKGAGIVDGTTVSSVNSATSLTLSQNTTASAAGTVELLFAPATLPLTYPSPMGWIQPGAGPAGVVVASASTNNSTVTVNATAHGLVNGQSVLITGITGATIVDGYNGYVPAITVVTADQFTFPRVAVLGAATVNAALSKVWKNFEVAVAIGGLQAAFVDFAVIPTFTAAVTLNGSGAGVQNYETGDVFTVTLTSSEAVEITNGIPSIVINITSGNKAAVYNELTSTSTNFDFDYTLVAGDIAVATGVTVATSMTANGAKFFDLSGSKEAVFTPGSFSAPSVTTVTFN